MQSLSEEPGVSMQNSYRQFKDIDAKTSAGHVAPESAPHSNKAAATKIMMQEAIRTLSTKFRKGFSLDKIRKYISQNYLLTANELKHRIPIMRKFFKNALESGDIVSVRGAGLTGSFRVLPTSPLHKNSKQTIRKLTQPQARENSKKVQKNEKKNAVAKPKKIKVKRIFSANM